MIPTLNQATAGGGLAFADYAALAARSGFEAIDFSIDAAHSLGLEAAAMALESNGLLPGAIGLPVEWRKDEATFRAELAQLPELAHFAQDLGCRRCCTWVMPDGGVPVAEYSRVSLGRLTEIARILADNGVQLGLEFLGPQHFRPDPQNVWFYDIAGGLRVADEINSHLQSNNVGLLVDCWHWYAGEGSTMDLASIPLEQIVHVHVNDAPSGVAVSDLRDNVRELPGATGEIDIVGFLSTLGALGYDGPIAVETFSEKLKQLTPDEAANQAGASMKRIFEAAGVKPMRIL